MQQYDLVIFGATSFVGKILTRYMFAEQGLDGDIKWAIAGRAQDKLDQLKNALGETAATLPTIVADTRDADRIDALCASTRVLISTVGPYALYGEPVVKSCAEHGTDYCDLTGEAQWIHKMIERYETTAKESGARIVHSCGFDSIPSDLGVFFLQEKAMQKLGRHCETIKMRVKVMKGAASGGTVASMMQAIKEGSRDKAVLKQFTDPYSLCPPQHPYTAKQPNVIAPKYDSDVGAWIAPFIMSPINIRVVHRSNALLHSQYGENFIYDEAMMTGKNALAGLGAAAFSAGVGGFMLAAVIPPSRWLMEKTILPKPGEGPSLAQQREGYYDLRFIGKTTTGEEIRCKVTGDRDPGYGSTAKILGQAGLCLAQDISKDDQPGGFWTPASLLGNKLIGRLEEHAGVHFREM